MTNSIAIQVKGAGKKFGKEWIFKNVDLTIQPGEKVVILGLNGSGKSTLLQALSGYLEINKGSMEYANSDNGTVIDKEKQYHLVSLASPYLELIEDFTLSEMVEHASIFKPFIQNLSVKEVVELSGLAAHHQKYIKLFSSGMKQRLKLTLAILADAPVLLLDEPTTNLDASVIKWYLDLIRTYAAGKTIIVASNSIPHEYEFCNREIQMSHFKTEFK